MIERAVEQYLGQVEWAVSEARRQGADQAEAAINVDRGLSVTARLREVETLEYQTDRTFGVTVFRGQSRGSASTADLSEAAILETITKASFIASQTESDPCAGLADEKHMAHRRPQIELDFPWHENAAEIRDLALACEAAALDFDAEITNSEGASVSTARSHRAYANSHDFSGVETRTRHSVSCAVIAGHEAGMERDYHYTIARDPKALATPQFVGEEAARRTLSRRGPRQPGTRTAPVVFSADLARGLFGHAAGAMSGGAQYRRSSFMLNGVGEALFPSWLSWHERPHLDGALGSSAYDAEGVATKPRVLVEAGAFSSYILSSYSARRLGLETTGNAGGLHNIDIESNQGYCDDMLAEMGEGLLVTELMGQGVNAVTGDYSRGAAGFWVENGRVAYPVSELTIAGNLKDMYSNIRAIGSDVDRRGVIRCGSVLVNQMQIASE